MPKVVISGTSCQRFTGGRTEFELAATPSGGWYWYWRSGEAGGGGDGVAIDGEIFQDAYAAVLRPESEIVLIPKIE